MDIVQAFNNAFKRKKEKKWEKIYVLVDIHDTIFPACYNNKENYRFYPYAEEVLQQLSQRDDVCLILWTSSFHSTLKRYCAVFKRHNIHFNYINENPEVSNTDFQDFSQKLYFNVGIDDKFGFCPEDDWETILTYLNMSSM